MVYYPIPWYTTVTPRKTMWFTIAYQGIFLAGLTWNQC